MAADESLHALSLRISEADFIHVLLNLLRNSYEDFVRHGKHDGRIVISAVRETSSTVTLRIEDNGSGLTLEEFESLTSLTHFNRTMHTSDAKHGLGLRLVRRLVERYDGELSLQANSALAGTAFHLTLQTSVDQPRGLVQ
ncbi:MAG: sensor histidine kinase [Deltaproteobacteria bacterium]|nr:sensor histidine kinase [Deltaproteobacteria bacterium]